MSDKEKLIEMIKEAVGGCTTYWASLIADHLIANGVTVRKHGRWVWKDGKLFCSACSERGEAKRHYEDGSADEYSYCPNCGVDMRGG